jgi:hypothetical protein
MGRLRTFLALSLTLLLSGSANAAWPKVTDAWHKVDTSGGGGGAPGGSNTQVQFNDSGAFGGDAGLTYNKATDTLTGKTVVTNNLTATALATPGSITVAPQGTGGAVTWTYKLVARLADGTTTQAGAASSTAAGNATLDGTNFNRLTWSAVTGAASYDVYRTVAGTTPATTGKIVSATTALTADDKALAGGGETAPTTNGTGVLTGRHPSGTSSLPGVAFAAQPALGMYLQETNLGAGSNVLGFRTLNGVDAGVSGGQFRLKSDLSFGFAVNDPTASNLDTALTRGAAATWQLGLANAAAPVDQTLRAQGGSGADKPGAKFTLQGGIPTGTGLGGSIALQTTPPAASTSSTAGTPSTRYYVNPNPKVLTLGSATDFVNVNFPASSTVTVAIGYNVDVYDSAAPVQRKGHGGRYYVTAYRLATGNAVAGTVVETGDSSAFSVGDAMTDSFAVTGTATGITISQNVTVGTGLTAPNVGVMTWDAHVHGAGMGITVVPVP